MKTIAENASDFASIRTTDGCRDFLLLVATQAAKCALERLGRRQDSAAGRKGGVA